MKADVLEKMAAHVGGQLKVDDLEFALGERFLGLTMNQRLNFRHLCRAGRNDLEWR